MPPCAIGVSRRGCWLAAVAVLATLGLATADEAAAGGGGNPTVAAYVINRLADLGCDKMFGVPGDFAFPINDAVEESSRMQWVASANELNAAYAADGYARIKGVGCYSDTYGVGEMSSINGMMGAKAEWVPVFHVAGCPSTRLLDQRRMLHHTLGTGAPDDFFAVSCASAVACTRLTALNTVDEMERVITAALTQRGPVFIQIPTDVAEQPVIGTPVSGVHVSQAQPIRSDPAELAAAVNAITARLAAAQRPVILPSIHLSRLQLNGQLAQLLDATGIPFTTTGVDKGVAPETHTGFLGIYGGNFSFPPALAERVEGADLVLNLGDTTFSDIVVGYGSVAIPEDAMIVVGPSYVRVYQGAGDVDARSMRYSPVWIGDVLSAIASTGRHAVADTPDGIAPPLPEGAAELAAEEQAQLANASAPISYETITHALQGVLEEGDIVFAECGTTPSVVGKVQLPANVSFNGQFVWGAIGWGGPAAEGAKAAAPDSRVYLISGEGAHHMTLNEIGFMCFHSINPIILILNNEVYYAEEQLEGNSGKAYNKMPGKYNFAALPPAMGCDDWLVTQVDNPPDLVAALEQAAASGGGAYIEARMTGPWPAATPQDVVDQFYLTKPLEADEVTM